MEFKGTIRHRSGGSQQASANTLLSLKTNEKARKLTIRNH